MLLGSTTTALADPGFRLIESTAGPGDTVHFAISDADDVKRFTIEVAGQTVVESGNKRRDDINGNFTMPDLGGSTRTVKVDARMKEHGDTETVSRTLRYLVPAVTEVTPSPAPIPVAAPVIESVPAPPPPAGPAAPAALVPPPAPAVNQTPHTSTAAAPSTTRARAPRRASRGRPTGRPRAVARTRDRNRKAKRTRSKRSRARTAPLFDGVPEPAGAPDGPVGQSSLNAIVEATATPASSRAVQAAGSGLHAAVVIPAVLGFAALLLAATAVTRSRRVRATRR